MEAPWEWGFVAEVERRNDEEAGARRSKTKKTSLQRERKQRR